MPRKPLAVRRMRSKSEPERFLVKNARSDSGDDVETFVNIDAIRAVEVDVVVAFKQLRRVQNVGLENRSPVPIPLLIVPVALCERFATSVMAPALVSDWSTVNALVEAMLLVVACEVNETDVGPPKRPPPPTLRLDTILRLWLNCARFITCNVSTLAEPICVLAM